MAHYEEEPTCRWPRCLKAFRREAGFCEEHSEWMIPGFKFHEKDGDTFTVVLPKVYRGKYEHDAKSLGVVLEANHGKLFFITLEDLAGKKPITTYINAYEPLNGI